MNANYATTHAAHVPGVDIELRSYHQPRAGRLLLRQDQFSIGFNSRRARIAARYPNMPGAEQFTEIGEVVLRPPHLDWEVDMPRNSASVTICLIDPERFQEVAAEELGTWSAAMLTRSMNIRSRLVYEGLMALRAEAMSPGLVSRSYVERTVDAMIVHVARYLRDRPAEAHGEGGLTQEEVAQIDAYLATVSGSYPRIQDLAGLLGFSPRSLRTRYKRATGAGLSGHIAAVQLEKAAEMLRTTDLPLKEIAFRVGYGHVSNFSGAFQRRFNQPPSQYRRIS